MIKRMNFFMAMIPPTATHQQQRIRVVERSRRHVPQVYDGAEVAAARSKLTAHLAAFRPSEPLTGPVSLLVKWCFPLDEGGRHHNQAGHRQCAEAAQGLHDRTGLLAGRCAGVL